MRAIGGLWLTVRTVRDVDGLVETARTGRAVVGRLTVRTDLLAVDGEVENVRTAPDEDDRVETVLPTAGRARRTETLFAPFWHPETRLARCGPLP